MSCSPARLSVVSFYGYLQRGGDVREKENGFDSCCCWRVKMGVVLQTEPQGSHPPPVVLIGVGVEAGFPAEQKSLARPAKAPAEGPGLQLGQRAGENPKIILKWSRLTTALRWLLQRLIEKFHLPHLISSPFMSDFDQDFCCCFSGHPDVQVQMKAERQQSVVSHQSEQKRCSSCMKAAFDASLLDAAAAAVRRLKADGRISQASLGSARNDRWLVQAWPEVDCEIKLTSS
ncbi:uncharacterized protein phf21b isoform X2 [Gambusia affinis]|uniref:uncharacterized protein phf21b isoform X2 n=1 Tax=Gambusia affinis TaxID=33528 RepID=UPI001CDC5AB8|nr:uncharacterized protein phf21b isoform X2 [Gambusia affinis]